jgi:hypothetical protein
MYAAAKWVKGMGTAAPAALAPAAAAAPAPA